jgi:hypothetical protein
MCFFQAIQKTQFLKFTCLKKYTFLSTIDGELKNQYFFFDPLKIVNSELLDTQKLC